MPERNHEVMIEGRTFPDTVTVWLDDGTTAQSSRDYVSKDLYESVDGACEYWQAENESLRELCKDMWRLIEDLDATPYVTEREGNNPAVTWLDEDWSVHDSCRSRMRELGMGESE